MAMSNDPEVWVLVVNGTVRNVLSCEEDAIDEMKGENPDLWDLVDGELGRDSWWKCRAGATAEISCWRVSV